MKTATTLKSLCVNPKTARKVLRALGETPTEGRRYVWPATKAKEIAAELKALVH